MEKLRAETRGNQIEVFIADEVPSHLLADQNRFQQVFLNVLNNANKFTKRGKVKVFCTFLFNSHSLPTKDKKRFLQVRVVDEGPGISILD